MRENKTKKPLFTAMVQSGFRIKKRINQLFIPARSVKIKYQAKADGIG
jgi:hypothetical protein